MTVFHCKLNFCHNYLVTKCYCLLFEQIFACYTKLISCCKCARDRNIFYIGLNGSSVRTLKFSHYIRFFTISDLIVNNFHRIYILNLIFSKKFFYQFHKIQRLFSFLEDFLKIPVISFSKAENPEIWQHWVLQLCSFRRQAAPDHDTTEDENKTLSGMKYFPS